MDAGAYTVGVLGGYDDEADAFYVVDVVRGQWDAGQREQVIRQVAAGDERALGGVLNFEIVMEQEPGSGGKESAEATMKRLTGYRCKAHHPTGDKFVRADPLAGAAKNGQVWLVAGDWNEDYLRVMENAGPGATYLDDMDATSGAFNHLLLNRRQAVPSVAPGGGTKPSYWRSA
jgi:predicted phage terminase large subunit-like protein